MLEREENKPQHIESTEPERKADAAKRMIKDIVKNR